MLQGAIIGAIVGLVFGVIYALFGKGRPCPQCDKPLPVPWFRAPRRCPQCGCHLDQTATDQLSGTEADEDEEWETRGRGSRSATVSTGRMWSLWVAIGLALAGVALVLLFLPGALESRRVWQHQQRQVDMKLRQMDDLAQRRDAESQKRLTQLREQFRRDMWHPEGWRKEFYTRLAFVILGGGCLLASGALLLFRWVRRPAPSGILPVFL